MFLDAFYSNPMAFIGAVFACIGAFGFVLFFVGLFPGLPHLFTLSAHDGHLEHHRVRVTWGVLILVHAFILWEVVRLVASWFGSQPIDGSIAGGLVLAYFIVLVVLSILFGISKSFNK